MSENKSELISLYLIYNDYNKEANELIISNKQINKCTLYLLSLFLYFSFIYLISVR